VACLLLVSSACAGTEDSSGGKGVTANLERGVLGLNWGATVPEVLKNYPDARTLVEKTLLSVRQANASSVSVDKDTFVLRFDAMRGLSEVTFQVPPPDVQALIRILTQSIGTPRSVAISTVGGTTHVFEWSSPKVSARVRYATTEAAPTSRPLEPAVTAIMQGTMSASYIDEYQQEQKKWP
jgi:hypothetical protein